MWMEAGGGDDFTAFFIANAVRLSRSKNLWGDDEQILGQNCPG